MFETLSNYSENMFSQIDDVDIFQVSSPIENIKNQICKWESKSRPFVYEECHLDLSRLYSWMLEQILNYISLTYLTTITGSDIFGSCSPFCRIGGFRTKA